MNDKPEDAANDEKTNGKRDRYADALGAGVARVLQWLADRKPVRRAGGWLHRTADSFSEKLFEPIYRGGTRIGATVLLLCGFALLALARPIADLAPNIACWVATWFQQSQCADGAAFGPGWAILGSFVALAFGYVVARVAFTLNSKVASIECATVKAQDRPSRVIITGLSTWNKQIGTPEETRKTFVARQKAEGGEADMKAFCAADFFGGNWQQTIRRVWPDIAAGTLEKVYVIPSLQSCDQWDDFEDLVRKLGGEDILGKFVRMPSVDYEEFELVSAAIAACVDKAVKEAPNLKPQDICIDITAGFKVFSAAAALFTLNRALAFSYVIMEESKRADGSTAPKGAVRLYDAQARFYRDFDKTLGVIK